MSTASQQQPAAADDDDDDDDMMVMMDNDTAAGDPVTDESKPVVRGIGGETSATGGETSGTAAVDDSKPVVRRTGGETGAIGGETSGTAATDDSKPVVRPTGSETSATGCGSETSGTTAAAGTVTDNKPPAVVVRSTGDDSSAAGETSGTTDAAGTDAGGGDGMSDGGAVSVWEDVECKFNVNSYQMIFVVNTKSFLYRRQSLATARQVCIHHSLALPWPPLACKRFKLYKALHRNLPVTLDHTLLFTTRHRWTWLTLTSAREAGTWFAYPGQRDGRLSWPWWFAIYQDGLPVCRQSPILVVTSR